MSELVDIFNQEQIAGKLQSIADNLAALQLQLEYERTKIITALGGEPFIPDTGFLYSGGRLSTNRGIGFYGSSTSPVASGTPFDLATVGASWGRPCAFLVHVSITTSSNIQSGAVWLLLSAWASITVTELGSSIYYGSKPVLTASNVTGGIIKLTLTQNSGVATNFVGLAVVPITTFGETNLVMLV